MVRLNRPFRRGQPVPLLVLARALILEIQVERTVRVVLERHPTADCESIEAVRDLEAVPVIERDRPEGVHGRDGGFVEVDRVVV